MVSTLRWPVVLFASHLPLMNTQWYTWRCDLTGWRDDLSSVLSISHCDVSSVGVLPTGGSSSTPTLPMGSWGRCYSMPSGFFSPSCPQSTSTNAYDESLTPNLSPTILSTSRLVLAHTDSIPTLAFATSVPSSTATNLSPSTTIPSTNSNPRLLSPSFGESILPRLSLDSTSWRRFWWSGKGLWSWLKSRKSTTLLQSLHLQGKHGSAPLCWPFAYWGFIGLVENCGAIFWLYGNTWTSRSWIVSV